FHLSHSSQSRSSVFCNHDTRMGACDRWTVSNIGALFRQIACNIKGHTRLVGIRHDFPGVSDLWFQNAISRLCGTDPHNRCRTGHYFRPNFTCMVKLSIVTHPTTSVRGQYFLFTIFMALASLDPLPEYRYKKHYSLV